MIGVVYFNTKHYYLGLMLQWMILGDFQPFPGRVMVRWICVASLGMYVGHIRCFGVVLVNPIGIIGIMAI